MQIIDNIPVFGEHEANTMEQARACARTADHFALMADGHLGYGVPIGGVIASESRISPTAVGFDIACGNKAVGTGIRVSDINVKAVMDDVWKRIDFGIGPNQSEEVEHPVIDEIDGFDFLRGGKAKYANQLGSIGGGNHYVDLFEDTSTGELVTPFESARD